MDLSKKDNESYNDYFGRLAKIQDNLMKDSKENKENKAIIKKINDIVYNHQPLRQYIETYCHSSWPTYYMQYKEDLINSGCEEFFRNFHKFDSSRAELITFSKLHVLHGVQKFIAFITNKRTVFEKEIAANVEIVKKLLLDSGFTEDTITASIIHTYLPKYAYTQIEACLKGNTTVQSLIDTDIEVSGPKTSSAESEYIKQSYGQEASKIFQSIPKYEAFLLTTLDPDSTSKKMYQDYEKNDELITLVKEAGYSSYVKKDEKGEEYIPAPEIRKMFAKAKKHIFHAALISSDHYRNIKSKRRFAVKDNIDFSLFEAAVENEEYLFKEFN